MRFVCFGYINETDWEKMPEQEQQETLQNYFNYYKQLKAMNVFLGGTGLKNINEGCKLSLKDNILEELNLKRNMEQLGGFFFLEAANLEEAKSVIAKHPGLKVGAFEIRVVDEAITKLVGAT